MKAIDAITQLNPNKWAETTPVERLYLLEAIRTNIKIYGNELAVADYKLKNNILGAHLYPAPTSKLDTIVPMVNTISVAINLYKSLINQEILRPLKAEKIEDDLFNIYVFRQEQKGKLMYADRKDLLYVTDQRKQINPMDKPVDTLAVLGTNNHSSSLEIVKAIFFKNCTVVHKSHHLSAETDKVWKKIMQPLIEHGVLSFCDSDQGQALNLIFQSADPRLTKISFIGVRGTAEAIMLANDTPSISECDNNNTCILSLVLVLGQKKKLSLKLYESPQYPN